MTKNTVYMAIGIPGSGKSTWWEAAVKNGTIPGTALRINMDTIRKELTGSEGNMDKNDLVAKVAKSTLLSALANKIEVIYWDNTSAKRKYRRDVIEAAKKAGYDVIGIWFDVPLDIAKARNAARDRKVPEFVLENMHHSLQETKPDLAEGFTQVIVVN
jgi:predicted kinase